MAGDWIGARPVALQFNTTGTVHPSGSPSFFGPAVNASPSSPHRALKLIFCEVDIENLGAGETINIQAVATFDDATTQVAMINGISAAGIVTFQPSDLIKLYKDNHYTTGIAINAQSNHFGSTANISPHMVGMQVL